MAFFRKFGIFNKIYNMDVKGAFSSIRNNTVVNTVTGTFHKAFNTVGNVIESGGSILAAPANWIKSIQKNWVLYLALAAIIMVCIVFLYCSVCYYVNRYTTTSFSSNLIELATVINEKKNNALKPNQPQELSVNNLTNFRKK